MIAKLGAQTDMSSNIYHGPVASEIIYQSNTTPKDCFYFTTPGGSIYSGPVHVHNGMPMEGSFHGSYPHGSLTVVRVPNQKIIDTRRFNHDLTIPSIKPNKASIFSELYCTVGFRDKAIKGVFSMNMDQICRRHFDNGDQWDAIRILASLLRVPIKYNIGVKFIREKLRVYSKKDYQNIKVINSEVIGLGGNSGFGGKHINTIEDNLGPKVVYSDVYRKDGYKQISKFKTIEIETDPLGDYIVYYQFSDMGVVPNSDQDIRYRVEYNFVDHQRQMFSEILSKLQDDITILESLDTNFYNLKNLENLDKKFFSSLSRLIEIKQYFTNNTNFLNHQINKIIFSLKHGDPSVLNDFILQSKKIVMNMKSKFKIVTTKSKLHSLGSSQKVFSSQYRKKEKNIKVFKEIISMKEYSSGYSFHKKENILSGLVSYEKEGYDKMYQTTSNSSIGINVGSTSSIIPSGTTYGTSIQKKSFPMPTVLTPVMVANVSQNLALVNDIVFGTVLDNEDPPMLTPSYTSYKMSSMLHATNHQQVNDFMVNIGPTQPKINFTFFPLIGGLGINDAPHQPLESLVAEKDIDYIQASEYVGDDSPLLTPQIDIIKNTSGQLSFSSDFNVKNKSTIDMLSLHINNKSGQPEGGFSTEAVKQSLNLGNSKLIPSQIVSMSNYLSDVNSPIDKLKIPELNTSIQLKHFIMQKVFYLSGYRKDKLGNPIMNSPVWVEYRPDENIPNNSLMKMEYYEDQGIKMKSSNNMKLKVYDKYFILNKPQSAEDNIFSSTRNRVLNKVSSVASFAMSGDKIEYLTTNPVIQNKERMGMLSNKVIKNVDPTNSTVFTSAKVSLVETQLTQTGETTDAPANQMQSILSNSSYNTTMASSAQSPVSSGPTVQGPTSTSSMGGGTGGY